MESRIILVRIKFVVPLRIPAISSTSLAARHWLIGRIMGMPPPTLASKRKLRFFFWAMLSSSAPFAATSSLLEVTTLFPFSRHAFTKSNAGCSPPITSATIVTSGSFRIIWKSFTKRSCNGLSGKSRISRMYLISISSLARRAMLSAWLVNTSATPEPTVP